MKRWLLVVPICACTAPRAELAPDASVDSSPPTDAPVVWPAAPDPTFVDATGLHPTITMQAPADYAATAAVARPLGIIPGGYGSDIGPRAQGQMGFPTLATFPRVGPPVP